jgi:hypothetical protein
MQTLSWKSIGLRLSGGLLACLVTMGLPAETPAGEGFVRISDRLQPAGHVAGRLRPTSFSDADSITHDGGTVAQSAPFIVHEGPAYEMTGNPLVDMWRTASMKRNAWTTRLRLQAHARHGYCPTCHHRARGGLVERIVKSASDHDMAWKRRLLGYFVPDGCCGQGCPAWGNYHLLYSANPDYLDQRDGRVYAAQGYGTPVAVPLAPNVSHTYNYGWGIPSSRLTPVSNRAPW